MIKQFAAIGSLVLLAACGIAPESPEIGLDSQSGTNGASESSGSTPVPEATNNPVSLEKASITPTSDANCLGPEMSKIGQEIANRFDETNYEQVMIWFCNGAEFEDISLALLTEQRSEASAEEMLVMLADGLNWDDIWLIVGVTE